MTHIWIRAEERPNEQRVGVTPGGVTALVQAGFQVTLEEDPSRAIALADYTGCSLAATGSWRTAPKDAIIFGLKELPDDDNPLVHRHIMFGHAYKGQPDGARLLERFNRGGFMIWNISPMTLGGESQPSVIGLDMLGRPLRSNAGRRHAAARYAPLCRPFPPQGPCKTISPKISAQMRGQR